MKEHEKRFRIEFTVDVHNEGVTKEWDWSNDDIKEMALQELDCMSPWPFNVTFSEVEDDCHTETPTNGRCIDVDALPIKDEWSLVGTDVVWDAPTVIEATDGSKK